METDTHTHTHTQTDTQTHKPSTVTLAAHARRGLTTERSTSDSLGDISSIQKAALQLYRRNVPLLHMSGYVITRDSVLPSLPLR